MPPLRLCTDRHSVGHFRYTRGEAPSGVVRIAQIEIGMLRPEYEIIKRMVRAGPSFFRRSDLERQHAMRDIVEVAHGYVLPRKEVLEQKRFIHPVQGRPRADDHPFNIRLDAVEIERLEQRGLDEPSGP